jgi:hypothetical protein
MSSYSGPTPPTPSAIKVSVCSWLPLISLTLSFLCVYGIACLALPKEGEGRDLNKTTEKLWASFYIIPLRVYRHILLNNSRYCVMQSIIHSGIVVYVEDLSLPWPTTGNMLKGQYHAISKPAPQWHCWCPHAIRKNNRSFHSSFIHCQLHGANNALKVTAKTYDCKLFLCRNFIPIA